MPDWVLHLLELAVWGIALAALAALAAYVVGKVRAEKEKEEPTAGELLAKFREMHSQGVLSDAEYRTIKTSLYTHLREELKDTGETGCDD
jgi:hypothetical protein